jgi:hypothetical protein
LFTAVVWALHSVGVQTEREFGVVMIYDNGEKETGIQDDAGLFGAGLKMLRRAIIRLSHLDVSGQ